MKHFPDPPLKRRRGEPEPRTDAECRAALERMQAEEAEKRSRWERQGALAAAGLARGVSNQTPSQPSNANRDLSSRRAAGEVQRTPALRRRSNFGPTGPTGGEPISPVAQRNRGYSDIGATTGGMNPSRTNDFSKPFLTLDKLKVALPPLLGGIRSAGNGSPPFAATAHIIPRGVGPDAAAGGLQLPYFGSSTSSISTIGSGRTKEIREQALRGENSPYTIQVKNVKSSKPQVVHPDPRRPLPQPMSATIETVGSNTNTGAGGRQASGASDGRSGGGNSSSRYYPPSSSQSRTDDRDRNRRR